MTRGHVLVRAATTRGGVRAVVEVTDRRTVQIRTGGVVIDEDALALLVALGTPPPGWALAAPVQAALAADSQVDPTDVLSLVRSTTDLKARVIALGLSAAWEWHALATDASARVRAALAATTAALGGVRDSAHDGMGTLTHRLAVDDSDDVRRALAKHLPVTPAFEAALDAMQADADPGIALLVARRRVGPTANLPAAEAALVLSADSTERWQACALPTLSGDSAHLLAADPDEDVRRRLAQRSDLSVDLVLALARDRAMSVQMQIALYAAPTRPLAAALLASPSQQVRDAALARALGAAAAQGDTGDLASYLKAQGLL